MLVWVKPTIGIGNYWRASHEFLLFGLKGKLEFGDHAQRSWFESKRTRHSAKPQYARELVELVSPAPYLELYGREKKTGWVVYGNQVDAEQRRLAS